MNRHGEAVGTRMGCAAQRGMVRGRVAMGRGQHGARGGHGGLGRRGGDEGGKQPAELG